MSKPNIVFCFPDQQRWDTVGCYNADLAITPHLDMLAQSGVKFEHTFTAQPVCGPTRSCIQTGKYATETGCFRNDIALPTSERTIAHWLNEAGYLTGYVGKWHLASTGPKQNYRTRPVPPELRGGWKDYWVASDVLEFTSHSYDGHLFDAEGKECPIEGYRVDAVTDYALAWLEKQEPGRPFALFFSPLEPHQQNDHNRFEGPHGSKERFGHYPLPPDLTGPGDYEENWGDYLGAINSLDYNVGRIYALLQAHGLADNTLFIYTSDHGCHFRTRNGEYKRSCHESSIHVPLIIKGPGFEGGKTISELVSLLDLPPTLLYAAGIEPPAYMRGRPLQTLVSGEAKAWPEDVFFQISESQVGRGIRTRKWKYSVKAPEKEPGQGVKYPAADLYVEDYLYDLENDPAEQHNLVSEPGLKQVRAELRERLLARMAAAGEAPARILSQEEV